MIMRQRREMGYKKVGCVEKGTTHETFGVNASLPFCDAKESCRRIKLLF